MALKTNLLNNREALFCAWSVQSGYKSSIKRSFETPGYELRSRGTELGESSELAVAE
jgi:hypothetical protein